MAAIPGSVPLTGKVAPTDTTDTFATHMDIYGEGGYMAVADTATRNLITEDRRKLGMAVCTTSDNKIYTLTTNPAGATTVDGDWTEFTSGSAATLQDVYDSGSSGSAPYIPPYSATDVIANTTTGSVINSVGNTVTGETASITLQGDPFGTGQMNSVLIQGTQSASADYDHGKVVLRGTNSIGYSEIKLSRGEIQIDINGDTGSVGQVLTATTGNNVEWQPGVQTTKVSLSNAEIQALDVTPIELIAAPGAGKFIQLLSVYGFLDYTAPAFNAVDLRIRSFGSSSYLGEFDTPFTSTSADKKETWKVLSPGSWIDNTKIEIYATGATGAGGSTIDVYLTYKIIDL